MVSCIQEDVEMEVDGRIYYMEMKEKVFINIYGRKLRWIFIYIIVSLS